MPLTFTENTSIDFDVHGSGPPLILISGLGFGRWGWFKQVPAFSRHFQTITFDARGERGLENGVADLTADMVALLEVTTETLERASYGDESERRMEQGATAAFPEMVR